MRVLVTGGAGYLGSLTSRALIDAGHDVLALDSLVHGGNAVLGLYPCDGFEFVRGDVRDDELVGRALERADAVVHLAAIVGDPACKRDPDVSREVNLDASVRLYERAAAAGVKRFLFASTCSNYGRMGDPTQYVTEDSPLSPLSVYAETKVAVEKELLAASNGAVPTVLRFATLFGLAPRMRLDLTVNQFAAELLVNRTLDVFGEQFWRPYVHARDAARAIAQVLEADADSVGGQVFNVGDSRENYQKQTIVEIVQEEIPEPVEVKFVHVDEDPRDYRVSFDKFRDALGFEASRSVRDGIREVLAATREGVLGDIADARYRN